MLGHVRRRSLVSHRALRLATIREEDLPTLGIERPRCDAESDSEVDVVVDSDDDDCDINTSDRVADDSLFTFSDETARAGVDSTLCVGAIPATGRTLSDLESLNLSTLRLVATVASAHGVCWRYAVSLAPRRHGRWCHSVRVYLPIDSDDGDDAELGHRYWAIYASDIDSALDSGDRVPLELMPPLVRVLVGQTMVAIGAARMV
jgi:hypothetical protein